MLVYRQSRVFDVLRRRLQERGVVGGEVGAVVPPSQAGPRVIPAPLKRFLWRSGTVVEILEQLARRGPVAAHPVEQERFLRVSGERGLEFGQGGWIRSLGE